MFSFSKHEFDPSRVVCQFCGDERAAPVYPSLSPQPAEGAQWSTRHRELGKICQRLPVTWVSSGRGKPLSCALATITLDEPETVGSSTPVIANLDVAFAPGVTFIGRSNPVI